MNTITSPASKKPKTILITGGTGFIGQTLCTALAKSEFQITVLTRSPEKIKMILGDHITPFMTPLSHLHKLKTSDHFDAIINLAGAPIFAERWTNERKETLFHSRLEITEELIEFISRTESKPEVLLSGSAVGFYGDQGNSLIDETSANLKSLDGFSHHLCAEWEKAALKAKNYGVRVCLLRTGLVIGKNGGFLQPMILPFKLGLGAQLGNGQQWMPWIHMDDYIAICLLLLNNKSIEGAINLTGPNPVTNQVFTKTLAQSLHRPALLFAPTSVLKPLLGERSELLLNSQRAIPKRLLEAGFQFKFSELKSALDDVLN